MIRWLHISDLHIREQADWSNYCKEIVSKCTEIGKINLVIITGDYHDFKEGGNFHNSTIFIKNLMKSLNLDILQDLFIIPGNHDGVSKISYKDKIILAAQSEPLDLKKNDILTSLLKMFNDYETFVKELIPNYESEHPASVHIRTWRNKLNLVHCNTAIGADGKIKDNQLLDIDGLSALAISDKYPAILLAHNSFFDLHEKHQRRVKDFIRNNNIRAYLCGDKHIEDIKQISYENNQNKQIPCIVSYKSAPDMQDEYSKFGIIVGEWEHREASLKAWQWESGQGFSVDRTIFEKTIDMGMAESELGIDVTVPSNFKLSQKNLNGNIADVELDELKKYYELWKNEYCQSIKDQDINDSMEIEIGINLVDIFNKVELWSNLIRKKIDSSFNLINKTIIKQEIIKIKSEINNIINISLKCETIEKNIIFVLENYLLKLEKIRVDSKEEKYEKFELSKSIKSIMTFLKESTYKKAIFITGESGIGKSHIIDKAIKQESFQKNIFFIPIDLTFDNEDFEKCIIASINNIFNTEYATINDFNELITSLRTFNIKIIFVLDDFHIQVFNLKKAVGTLQNLMKNYTLFDWLYWVIVVNSFFLDHLISDNLNFNKYSILESSNNTFINGFLDLNSINEKELIGKKIIEEYGYDFKDCETNNSNNEIDYIFKNPLIAHIFCKTYFNYFQIKKIENINLKYIDFIKKYSEMKYKKLVNEYSIYLQGEHLENEYKKKFSYFFKIIMNSSKIKYKKNELESDINMDEAFFYTLKSNSLIKSIIIKPKIDIFDNNEYIDELYELHYYFYWTFKVAYTILNENDYSNIKNIINECVEGFEPVFAQYIVEYILLILDMPNKNSNNNVELEQYKKYFDTLLGMEKYSHLLFLMVNRASKVHNTLVSKAITSIDHICNLGQRDTYSYLYAIKYIDKNLLPIASKCKFISYMYSSISENELNNFLFYVVKSFIENVTNINTVVKYIYHFINCSNINIAIGLAEIFSDIIYNMQNKQDSKIIDTLLLITIQYKNNISKSILANKDLRKTTDDRCTFYEFLLKDLFYKIINSSMKVHNILNERNWYYKSELSNELSEEKFLQLRKLMCREVTVRYGQKLRSSFESIDQSPSMFLSEYKCELTKLILSEKAHEKKLAFHFISNAIVKKQDIPIKDGENKKNIYNEELCLHLLNELNMLKNDETLNNFFQTKSRFEFWRRVNDIAKSKLNKDKN